MTLLKNPLLLGFVSALIVVVLAVIDGNRKKNPIDGANVGKLGVAVGAVVSLVTYLAKILHQTNKTINGGNIGGDVGPELDVDTRLPQF